MGVFLPLQKTPYFSPSFPRRGQGEVCRSFLKASATPSNSPLVRGREKKTQDFASQFVSSKKDYRFFDLVLMQLVQILVFLPSIFLLCRLILVVRLVFTLEWLTLKPVEVPRPQIWQVRDIIFDDYFFVF